MRPRSIGEPIAWDGNSARSIRHGRTGFIEGAILYGLTAALPGLSNAALGFLTTGLTALVTTAASIGLQLLLTPKPAVPKAQDVQANIRQTLSARRRHYGRTKVGSVVVFGFRRGDKIYILHYIGEGPITGYVAYFLDRKPVTLDVNGFVEQGQYEVNDKKRVQILTTLGTMADEPFAKILSVFPELDRPMKPFRHRGCAMLLQIVEEVGTEDMPEVYPNNLPALEVIVDGLKPYDPRSATRALTDNAGLCLLEEAMDVYGMTPADSDKVNLASFGSFADHCDEAIGLKAGGTEKRYRSVGTIYMDAENEKRVKTIADVCNAFVYMDPQGRIAVRKRLSSTPSISLNAFDGDHLSVALESGRREQTKFNAVKVVYREALLNWKENEAYYRNAAAKTADGKELVEPVDAQLCPSGTQAQRLGKLIFHERNPDLAGTVVTGLQGLELIADPVFSIDLEPEDDIAFTARSGNLEFDPQTQTVSFDVASVADAAEDWDAATEEQEVVEVGPTLLSNVADVALTVTASVGLLANSAPVLNFAWTLVGGLAVSDVYSQILEVSLAGLDDWKKATVNQALDTAQFEPVADNASYDYRIRNLRGSRKFDWQPGPTPVNVVVDATPPGTPLDFIAPLSGSSVLPSASARNDNTRFLVFERQRRLPTVGAVTLLTKASVTANQDIALPADSPGAGTWRYFCTAQNGSGVAATTPADFIDVIVP